MAKFPVKTRTVPGLLALAAATTLSAASIAAAGAPAAQITAPGRPLSPPAGALVAPGPAPDLAMLATGDVIGYIDPCG